MQPGNGLPSERTGGPGEKTENHISLGRQWKDVHFSKSDHIIPLFSGFQQEVWPYVFITLETSCEYPLCHVSMRSLYSQASSNAWMLTYQNTQIEINFWMTLRLLCMRAIQNMFRRHFISNSKLRVLIESLINTNDKSLLYQLQRLLAFLKLTLQTRLC